MSNNFVIGWRVFHGYAVETYLACWGAVASGQSHAPGRTIGDPVVSFFRRQPQDGLQVAEAFHRNGPAWLGERLQFYRTVLATVQAQLDVLTDAVEAQVPQLRPFGCGPLTLATAQNEVGTWSRFTNRRQVGSPAVARTRRVWSRIT